MHVLAVLMKPYNISVHLVKTHTGINIEYEWYTTGSPRFFNIIICPESANARRSMCKEFLFEAVGRAESTDSWSALDSMDAPFLYQLYNVTISSSVGWFSSNESTSFYIGESLFDSENQ